MDSVLAVGGSPDEAEQFAELHNHGNQVPGGVNSHGFFTESWYTTSNGQNHYFNSNPAATILSYPPYTWAAHNPVGVWQLDVWDTACQN